MKMQNGCLKAILCMFLLSPLQASENQPRIGLVLGGGGALGFAHVGVLKVLEANHIPIDYIAGTSMGAIVAGMYACGMSPEEIEQQFLALDWWDVLKDKSPHQYRFYRRKVENKRYMDMEFGIADGGLAFAPGMAYGQKLNNVLSTFSLNCAGIRDFNDLNIPYRAVATDLRSGESVVLSHGDLAMAMRASMAVPGIFTPVELDGQVLVDGGVLNNIPVDAILDMGADIVIAVDVGASTALKSEMDDYNSLGEVVARTYTIVQRPSQEQQLARADVVIEPDLRDATSTQFHRAAEIIPTGQVAAEAHLGELQAYSVSDADFSDYLRKQRRRRSETVVINRVDIEGNSSVAEGLIRQRIHTHPGLLNVKTIYEDLNRIHGLGLFQTVSYELTPQDDGDYLLTYTAREKFWGPHYFHLGLKAESSSETPLIWSILLNYTRTQLNPYGGELNMELEGGGDVRRLYSEWYQPITASGKFFLAPSINLYSRDVDYYYNDVDVAEVEENVAAAELDAGISGFEYGEFRVGVQVADARTDGYSGFLSLGVEHTTVVAATTRFALDQLNDPVFPTRGYQFLANGLFAFDEAGSTYSFNRLEAKARLPLSWRRHTLTPRIALGSSLGTKLPFYALFDIGGAESFAGYAPYQFFGYYYGVGQLEYRYRIGQLPPTLGAGIYAVLRGDAGRTWLDADDIDAQDADFGLLTGLAADTIIGACRISVGKAEGLNPRLYFSIGNVF